MSSLRRTTWLLACLLSICLIECVDYRLNRSVLPSFYNLTINLQADADNLGLNFNGEVNITLHAEQPNVTIIALHKEDIEITVGHLYDRAGALLQTLTDSSLDYDETTQKLAVRVDVSLAVGANYTLHFKYTGKVNTDMKGLYFTTYEEESTGKMKWMVLTQLQRIYARLLLPCFDEPAFKARFQLHIGRPNGVRAISNTRLIDSTNLGDNEFMDHFEVTPPMSTYLLAFMVSDYQARGDIKEMAVVTRPQDYSHSEFSYNVSTRVVGAYGQLFDRPYKELGNQVLVHASSPLFPHNGMENWGLIIYRDPILIHKPRYSDGWNDKEMTIRILAHETSHMWFGDSVTFSWWSYFWLNEAFARYYEYFMAHHLYPEYHLDEQFVVRQMQLIFASDARNSTQPMSSPEKDIASPSQIASKFSSITYAKGASIVRMWRNAMGSSNFDEAICNYLREHHLGNTEPKHLFAHLKANWPKQQNVDLDQFFFDFTEQVGFPTIMVKRRKDNKIRVTQQRFLLNPGDGSDGNLRYTVPITFTTSVSPNFFNLTPSFYFNKTHSEGLIVLHEPFDWIILNLKQSNYYRVQYEPELLRSLQEALSQPDHSGIPVENRAALIDDLFNFALIGSIDYVDVFQFLEYMRTEVDYVPWYAAYVGMQRVADRLSQVNLYHFNSYLRDITATVYGKLGVGWSKDDKIVDVYNRNKQVSWLCKYQHSDCNTDVFLQFESTSEEPSPDYRETFYCAASRSGAYSRIIEKYREETNPSEKGLLWRAASCTREYETHYFKEILGTATTVSEKREGLAQLYVQNPEVISALFQLITKDISLLAQALDSWEKTAQSLSDMADYFTTHEQREHFSDFYTQNHKKFGDSSKILLDALSRIDANLDWSEENLEEVTKFLANRNAASGVRTLSAVLLLSIAFNFVWGKG